MPLPRSSERILDRLQDSVCHALEVLTALGVDHADVAVGQGTELSVSVRRQGVELVKEAQSSGLSVRVIRDGRVATSSTTDLDPEAVTRFLETAADMAEISEEDPLAAPPEPEELVTRWPDLDLFDPRTNRIGAERGIRLALRAEKAAYASDSRITASDGASFGRSCSHSVRGTTGGFMGRLAGTYQSLAVHAIADDEGGKKRPGIDWTGGRHLEDLRSPAEVGREAASRAVRALGATKVPTGKYPVVFDRDAARQIVGLFAGCVLGDSVYRERSYLARKLGKRVASDLVTFVDDPLIPRAPGSRPYDGEGRKVRKIVVAAQGKLQSFLLDSYSARKLKLAPTGSAAGGGGIPHSSTSNFYLKKGRLKPASLLRGIDRGIYVVRMMGFGFDAVTGNFSRGAEGFLIEDGELTRPVSEITISRNLHDLLLGVDAVANDLEHRTGVESPSFRVKWMTVGGD